MQWKGNKIAVVAVLLLLMLDYISGVIILAASDIICNLWNYNSQVFPVELNSLSLSCHPISTFHKHLVTQLTPQFQVCQLCFIRPISTLCVFLWLKLLKRLPVTYYWSLAMNKKWC